jgi:hypothetical protein
MFTRERRVRITFETLAKLAEGTTFTPDERAEFMLRHDTFWLEG